MSRARIRAGLPVSEQVLVALAASILMAACGGGGAAVGAPTTTTGFAGVVAPLTGLVVDDAGVITRPALVAKIDNSGPARPQFGLNQADIVFEENIEGASRFAAVFHSTGSDPVGPLRSGRTQDIDLLGSLNGPLFVWSGGNARVTRAIRASDLVDLGPTPAPDRVYHRDEQRPAPHNLFTSTTEIWQLAPADSRPPGPVFTYRSEETPPLLTSSPVAGAKVVMDGSRIVWEWDESSGTFRRWLQNSRKRRLEPHLDAAGEQIACSNVVVIEVVYVRSPADRNSPEARTVGRGEAWVLTEGRLVRGEWERTDRTRPFTLTDSGGSVIGLTPGRTFVQLARRGTFAPVGLGVDPSTVPWPAP